jgi:hypothetical protein
MDHHLLGAGLESPLHSKCRKLVQTHRPACVATSFGWLADGKRLFVEFVVTDEDDGGAANHPDAYILPTNGVDKGAIPPGVGAFQYPGYVHAKFIDRHLLGQTPDYRSEPHLWVRDLNSGDEKELFSVPPPNPPQSPTPNILLSILGWTD